MPLNKTLQSTLPPISKDAKAKLQQIATKESRKLNAQLEHLIEKEYIKLFD